MGVEELRKLGKIRVFLSCRLQGIRGNALKKYMLSDSVYFLNTFIQFRVSCSFFVYDFNLPSANLLMELQLLELLS